MIQLKNNERSKQMNRGDIYYVARTYNEDGSEQQADRPAVIVSNNKNNERSGTVEVVYMTTQPKKDLPTHVHILSSTYPSTVLCEQIHTVSKSRVGDKIGTLTEEEAAAVDEALAISLGLKQEHPTSPSALTSYEASVKILCDFQKIQTERDVYKQLYNELLATITKGGGTQ